MEARHFESKYVKDYTYKIFGYDSHHNQLVALFLDSRPIIDEQLFVYMSKMHVVQFMVFKYDEWQTTYAKSIYDDNSYFQTNIRYNYE